MKLCGAKILIETLIEQGVDTIFGYPGGQVLNIYDELYNYGDKIKHVLSAHEQGAAHAAEGYARSTGKTGVVLATSGPGATNLVTGIADAYLDSVPLVAITGNVPCSLIGRDSFQEVDIVGITLPVTKHNFIVKDVAQLADTVREAFKIAQSGRPGPVLIDIPKDVQINETEFENKPVADTLYKGAANDDDVTRVIELINDSTKPFIYCGGGVIAADAEAELTEFAKLIAAPVGFSLMGLSAMPIDSENALGMVGMHGHYSATKAKSEADLLIALGVRFSDRATGDKTKYQKHSDIIHIDVDNAEIDKNIPSSLGVNCDVKTFLTALFKRKDELKIKDRTEWQSRINELKKFEAANAAKPLGTSLTPYSVIDAVAKYTDKDMPIATDVGQHQMWVAQRYPFRKQRTFITSGGLGTMGFGMGAAIGAAIATGKRSVLFTGDGSFGMNLNELATAVSQNIPLVVVIMNNKVLGMVRQWQTMFYNQHYSSTTLDRKTDFVKLAEAFGAKGFRADSDDSLDTALKAAFAYDGTAVIDCHINCDERVLPMIPPGGAVSDLILK